MADMANRFDGVPTIEELIGQLVGACSATRFWSGMNVDYPSGAGVFEDATASMLAAEAIVQAYVIMDGQETLKNPQG